MPASPPIDRRLNLIAFPSDVPGLAFPSDLVLPTEPVLSWQEHKSAASANAPAKIAVGAPCGWRLLSGSCYSIGWFVRSALLVIYVSAVFAVLLEPAIGWVHRRSFFGWSRGRASALLLIVLVVSLLLGGLFLIALPSLTSNMAGFGRTVTDEVGVVQERLHSVPLLRTLLTVVIAGAVALTVSPWHFLGVAIFYLAYQQVENAFLTPKIMKSQVSLSSAVVIVALLIGGELAGIAGALVAVPSAVLVSELASEYLIYERGQSDEPQG